MKTFLYSIRSDKINYNYNKSSNDGLMWLCRAQNLKKMDLCGYVFGISQLQSNILATADSNK